jgi:large subunit ribosomal protein L24
MLKIKRDDDVVIIAGKDKGKRGKVVRVLDNGKLIVAGINIVKRHTKPNPQAGIAGGIVEKEAAVDASNVAIYNAASGKADRVGFKVDGEAKVRVFKSTGEAIDA